MQPISDSDSYSGDDSGNGSDLVALLALVTHERQARDRGWWSALERCYTPAATIQTSWFDGTAAEYVELSKRMFHQTPSSHRLGLPVIDVSGARAIVEVPTTIEFRGVFRGVEVDVASHMRMLHRAEKTDGAWRFSVSVAVFDHDTMTPAIPTSVPMLKPDDLRGTRSSYRMLTLWMTDRGFTVPDDRHGVDRDAELTALYDDAYSWAGLSRRSDPEEAAMREFVVELITTVPEGTEQSEVDARRAAENLRVRELTAAGHLTRLWWQAGEWPAGQRRSIGVWRAADEADLHANVLGTLPLRPWMDVKVTALRTHHNDPGRV
ncbi:nuclear transport factor 2 family protein [Catenulispora sp. NL8]|uniref:Nuclear transport factor 2 family protein n=2 Tax=Catenulispora pinistramenti TaxID=2705254 RepID=A0ABS5KRG1_9ACTN|nr:muconolactone Delta-isomerase family protein [Catenulispora pinistramenti]MBS2548638.1 nuclear transport factor 2 family protein [Catenulispora pinistramenti]